MCVQYSNIVCTMKKALRVLLLEDSAADAELITHELRRSGMTAVAERVDSKQAFVTAVRDFGPDVVLADHSLADFDARAALTILRTMSPTTPLLIVTGSIQGDRTVASLRAGAQDLILKSNLARLAAAITAAISIRRPLGKLTRRQIEVLRLVAEGYRTRAIASELKLSVKTVESHRGEVMKRLGIHDVVSLVRYAVRIGLISLAADVSS